MADVLLGEFAAVNKERGISGLEIREEISPLSTASPPQRTKKNKVAKVIVWVTS
jgi:hypothetical protein